MDDNSKNTLPPRETIDRVRQLTVLSNCPVPAVGSYKLTADGYKIKGESVSIRQVTVENRFFYIRWRYHKGTVHGTHPDWVAFRYEHSKSQRKKKVQDRAFNRSRGCVILEPPEQGERKAPKEIMDRIEQKALEFTGKYLAQFARNAKEREMLDEYEDEIDKEFFASGFRSREEFEENRLVELGLGTFDSRGNFSGYEQIDWHGTQR